MSVLSTKPDVSGSPAWLDQVLGCLSPPFSFRNGGSAIIGLGASDHTKAQQGAAIPPVAPTASPTSRRQR